MYGARGSVGCQDIHSADGGTGVSVDIVISRAPCRQMGWASGRMWVPSMRGQRKISGRVSGVPCRQVGLGPLRGYGVSEGPQAAGAVSQGPPAL